jgi:DNA-binding transcriptional LysR family regulator
MDFSSLEKFCAVVTEQSGARAKHLARAQSNVTTRIEQLEEELKVQLFSTSGKRMTLTPNGHRILEHAQHLLSLAEEACATMNPEQPAGRLRLGTLESTAAARLPALLSTYHSRWPRVGLELSIGTSRSLVEDVKSGRLDCAFVADAGCQVSAEPDASFAELGLHATRAYSEDMVLVLPVGHPPVKRPEDVKVTTLAAFARGCTYRSVIERWLGTRDTEAGEYWTVMELASYHTMLACVAAGSCFALCPTSILNLQRAPMDFRTQKIGAIDTYLIARSTYSGSAYEALLRSVQAKRHFGLGSVTDQ